MSDNNNKSWFKIAIKINISIYNYNIITWRKKITVISFGFGIVV